MFYGWRIAAAGFGLQFLFSAFLMQAYGAYVAVLSQELAWSKTALAGGAALLSIEGAILGPILGWMVDRAGPRLMVQIGSVIFALGLMILGMVDTLHGFYGAVVVIALGGSMMGYFPLTVSLVHFFHRKRARALSIMSLGLAAGGLAMPLVGWVMQTYGWRSTAIGSGIAALLIGWPLASVVRRNPAEVGQEVDGIPAPPPSDDAAQSQAAAAARSFTAAEALRTRAFWLLGVAHALSLLVVTAVNVHAISHMREELRYSIAQASFVITLMTMSQAAGIVLGSVIGDRWEKRYIAAGCMVAHMSGLLMLTFAYHPALLVGFAVVHGMAWGLRGPFMQALRADYFGLQAIGMILGMSAVLIAAGQVAGPLVAGIAADITGNYRAGFVILALLAGSGSVMFLMAKRPT